MQKKNPNSFMSHDILKSDFKLFTEALSFEVVYYFFDIKTIMQKL